MHFKDRFNSWSKSKGLKIQHYPGHFTNLSGALQTVTVRFQTAHTPYFRRRVRAPKPTCLDHTQRNYWKIHWQFQSFDLIPLIRRNNYWFLRHLTRPLLTLIGRCLWSCCCCLLRRSLSMNLHVLDCCFPALLLLWLVGHLPELQACRFLIPKNPLNYHTLHHIQTYSRYQRSGFFNRFHFLLQKTLILICGKTNHCSCHSFRRNRCHSCFHQMSRPNFSPLHLRHCLFPLLLPHQHRSLRFHLHLLPRIKTLPAQTNPLHLANSKMKWLSRTSFVWQTLENCSQTT